ncbi:hypothetical protein AKJ16_DCAP03193 [Drosera capensis]
MRLNLYGDMIVDGFGPEYSNGVDYETMNACDDSPSPASKAFFDMSTDEVMLWHASYRSFEDVMPYPSDSEGWKNFGEATYDVSIRQTFQMRVALLWTGRLVDTKTRNPCRICGVSNDVDDPNLATMFHKNGGYATRKKGKDTLPEQDLNAAHGFVLRNCEKISPFERQRAECARQIQAG